MLRIEARPCARQADQSLAQSPGDAELGGGRVRSDARLYVTPSAVGVASVKLTRQLLFKIS